MGINNISINNFYQGKKLWTIQKLMFR